MYQVSHQGQQFGPYTVEQINEYLASGAFDASSHVYDANSNQWVGIMTLPGIMIPQAKAVQASSVNKLSADSFGAAEGPKRILITSQEKMGYAFKGIIGICVGPFVGLLGFFIFNLYLKYQKAVASGDTQVIILPLAILEALGGALVMAIGVGLVGFGFYHLYLIFSAKYTCSACNSIWSIDEIECPGCRKRKESEKEWERKYGKRES